MSRLKAPERRQQLVEVAIHLFAERGFDATTTAGIAAAAGVSEPILYRHFKNKQELFVEIVREVTKTTQDHWRDLLADVTDPAEALRTITREWPRHLQQCASEYQVIHSAIATSRDPTIQAVLHEHYTNMEAYFSAMIEDGERRGVFRPTDRKTTVWWLMYYGIGYSFMELSLGSVPGYDFSGAFEMTLRALLTEQK